MKKSVIVFLSLVIILVGVFSLGFWENITGKTIVDEGDYIVDEETGLMWQKEWKSFDFRSAVPYCEDLELAAYFDWRLPTIDELETIYGFGNSRPFKTVTSWYVSSTEISEMMAWAIDLKEGGIKHEVNKGHDIVARCVRGEIIKEVSADDVIEDVPEGESEEKPSLFERLSSWIKGLFE